MARSIRNRKLDSRTARREIRQGKETHWVPISRGRSLGYRRGRRGGTWVARFDAEGLRREEKLGEADDVLDSDGVQILSYEQALQKAHTFFHSALAEATGETPHSGPYSVREAVIDYLKTLEDKGDYESANYDFNRNVLPQLGAIKVAKLRRSKLNAWKNQLASRRRISQKKKPESPPTEKPMTRDERRKRESTTNRTVRRLMAALNYALEVGKVNANPMSWKIEPFKNADGARGAYLTEARQRDFITACREEPDFQKLVQAALHIGCRLSELGRLRVRNYSASSKTIAIEESKSGKRRDVLLNGEGAEFFDGLVANRLPDDPILQTANGVPWDKNSVKRPMRRACKAAEIPRLGFHQLRHSFATRMLTNGVPMMIVAKQLGHSSTKMLEKHYAHLADDYLREVINRVPGAGLNAAATSTGGTVVTIRKRASN